MEKKVTKLTRQESRILSRMFYLCYVALIHREKWQSDYLYMRELEDLREMRDFVLSRISVQDKFIERLNLDF